MSHLQKPDLKNFVSRARVTQRSPRIFLQTSPKRNYSVHSQSLNTKIPSPNRHHPFAKSRENITDAISPRIVSRIETERSDEAPTYTGPLKDELPHGFGIQRWPDGSYFQGVFSEGKRLGNGLAYFIDEGTFEGYWQDDQIIRGIHIYLTASPYKTYVGEFLNWLPHGQGCLTFKDHSTYDGEFSYGCYNGRGILKTSKFTYNGEWVDGRKDGWGTISTATSSYEGYWKRGVRHGLGFLNEERSNYQGYWENGKKSGYGVEEYSASPEPHIRHNSDLLEPQTPPPERKHSPILNDRRKEGYWQRNELIRRVW